MGVLISSYDFSGKYAIPQSIATDLDDFIDDKEEGYLSDLLGADLYAAFKATLTPTPPATQTNKPLPVGAGYLNIYNPLSFDYGSSVLRSKGMVTMLLGFLFFDYMGQIKYKATAQGMVSMASDTSKLSDNDVLYQYLNEATESYNTIQKYIRNVRPDLFTIAFNGQCKSFGISTFG